MTDRNGSARRLLGVAAAGGMAVRAARRAAGTADLSGRVAVITGGSRGLGLALAHELGERGAAVAICARNGHQVDEAVEELRRAGHRAMGRVADVRDAPAMEAFVDDVVARYGQLDLVFASAGILTVGPWDAMTNADLDDALGTMTWGVHHTVNAALRHLGPGGRIGVVTSIGGKISVPHLLPYSVAKFATVGYAEGLRSELAPRGIAVTTIVPGLMRTGSHVNALMKGRHAAEYTWFSAAAVLPGLATRTERAAQRMVSGVVRGDPLLYVGWWTPIAVRFHGLAPATTTRLAGLATRVLPGAGGATDPHRGVLGADTGGGVAFLTAFGRRAVHRWREDRR